MKKSKNSQSVADRILGGLQEFADTVAAGADLAEKFTVRQVRHELAPRALRPLEVKQTRQLLGASQAVFALFLGVSVKTVRSWEQGVNTPSVMACRFLAEIRHDPPYWIKRFREAVVVK